MAYSGFAIDEYIDTETVLKQLDELIQKPIYSIKKEELEKYIKSYFDAKCVKSKAMITEAKNIIPNGDQHDLTLDYPFPIVINKAVGNKLYDIDGNVYYDLLQADGSTIIGSNDPIVKNAIINLLNTCGPITGLFHEYEYKLAKKISECVPSVEKFRMFNSDIEACICAIQIARLKTKHKNILIMGETKRGFSDKLAHDSKNGETKNLLKSTFKHTSEFSLNDLEGLERKLKLNVLLGGTAAIYIEPLGLENGTLPLTKEFVKGCEELAHKYGALLICDEITSGFRMGLGGAQAFFDINPDLTIFGKIIAGDYPGVCGLGGHDDCMIHLVGGLDDNDKKIKQVLFGETTNTTVISCLAGYTTICEIENRNACEVAGRLGDRLTSGLQELIKKYDLPFVVYNQGSIIHLETMGTNHFVINWIKPWTILKTLKQIEKRNQEMEYLNAAYMAEGLIMKKGNCLYLSSNYTEEDIDDVLRRFDRVFAKCAKIED